MMIHPNKVDDDSSIYLEDSELCNWHHPAIMDKVSEITEEAIDQKQKALKLFSFVRDEIKFSINDAKSKASNTLKRGTGDCATKTNLHVAFLRAAGLPARFHLSKCRVDPLKGVVPNWLFKNMPSIASHFWPEVYLEGRWIACEGILDHDLYVGLLRGGLIDKSSIPVIDWDGEQSLRIFAPWLIKDRGTTPKYEDIYNYLDRNRREEGLPPRIVDKLFGGIVYSYFKRHTDRIRSKSSGSKELVSPS